MIRIVAFIGGGEDKYYRESYATMYGFIYPLFDTFHMERFPVMSATVDLEVNKAGTFEFTLAANHPACNMIQKFRNYVFVTEYYYGAEKEAALKKNDLTYTKTTSSNNDFDDCVPLFYGRTTLVETDLYGNKTVTCEGAINFLNDQITRVNDHGFQEIENFLPSLNYYGYFRHITDEAADYGIDKTFRYVEMRIVPPIFNDYSEYSKFKSKMIEIENNDTVLNIFNTYVLKECGGFFVPEYPRVWWGNVLTPNASNYYPTYVQVPITTMYYSYFQERYGVGDGGTQPLMLYDNFQSLAANEMFYSEGTMDSMRHTWLPFFCVGKNVISVSKEPALNEIITGVYPVGKNGLLLQNANNGDTEQARFIWDSAAVKRHSRIAVALSFPDVGNRSDLRYVAQKWLDRHVHAGYDENTYNKSLSDEFKITVTGPEPCELGYGKVLVRLMRDVLYSDDPATDTSNDTVRAHSMSRPVLSMHIDCFNPQNNTYTFGPYISDNYGDTTISTTKKELRVRSEYVFLSHISSSSGDSGGSGESGGSTDPTTSGGEYIEDEPEVPDDGVIVDWEPDPYTPPEVIIDL